MALILLQNISKYATVKPYANIRLDSKAQDAALDFVAGCGDRTLSRGLILQY